MFQSGDDIVVVALPVRDGKIRINYYVNPLMSRTTNRKISFKRMKIGLGGKEKEVCNRYRSVEK